MDFLTDIVKIAKGTALVSGFLIANFTIVMVFVAIIWMLIKNIVSPKNIENKVVVGVVDWLLAIVKFCIIIVCMFAMPFIVKFILGIYHIVCLKYGIKAEESIALFILGIIFIIGFFICIFMCIKFISTMALDSANAREMYRKDKRCL